MPEGYKIDSSPPVHRLPAGTRDFDRGLFRKVVTVLAVSVPASRTGNILRADAMRKNILALPKIRSVVSDHPNCDATMPEERLVLLRVTSQDDLTAEAKSFLETEHVGLKPYDLELNYDYWTADEILQSVLPESLCDGSPTGFAITGHLAHLNLNDDYLPYKHIIGQVVLDKNKRIRTVVNKLNNIHNQFRFFEMELLAGEPDFVVEHHESDCRFTFDFTKVYWNSRLHTEHERLVKLFDPADGVVADVFAGVGPFAVPAAKRGCAVLANDLNPESTKWLRRNVQDNHVEDNLRVFCLDGREFIRNAVQEALERPFPAFAGLKLSKRQAKDARRHRQDIDSTADGNMYNVTAPPSPPSPPRNHISHFVMNLPDSAIDFLDAFKGILSPEVIGRDVRDVYHELPLVHCHCFTRCLDPVEAEVDIRQRVQEKLGSALEGDVTLHFVRSVAPNKDMYCITFRLPDQVAYTGSS